MRGIGGGDTGQFLEITCAPDSTLQDEITALMAANDKVEGKLVKLTWMGNYLVTSPDSGDIPDGEIMTCEKDNESGYLLGVRLFHYPDQNGGHHTPSCIKTLAYTGIIGLGDSAVTSGADYCKVTDGTTGGWGAVIAKDTVNGTVDVLF